MNDLIVNLFVLALFAFSIGGREFEYPDTTVSVEFTDWEKREKSATEGMSFPEGMKIIDSLWIIIKAINVLQEKYFILDKRDWEPGTIEMLQYGEEGYFKK